MSLEKVATVGLRTQSVSARQFLSLMDELRRLVDTAGGAVIHEFQQTRSHPDPATLVGKGKVEEIAKTIAQLGIKTVIFDDDLTAAQQKNIEKVVKAKIIDRTRLILDIFAQRARTREGQLQIELAQLNYMVPRLTGAWRGYSQQMGGIGMRGPGERKIEVERRYARERIKRLEEEIEEMEKHRHHTRVSRENVPLPQIALVGYTNVGKSTLLNTLVKETAVYADDKLFATLDPTTRRVKLPSGRIVLFSDTVGFIQKLPPYLVAAFRSTLEEVAQASLLVHLVDATAENRADQEKTVLRVIKELKADHIPMITVTNKADAAPKTSRLRGADKPLSISGKSGAGVDALLKAIEHKLDKQLVEVEFELPYSERRLLADIYRTGHVMSETPNGTGSSIHMRMDPANWKRIARELNIKGATK